MQSTLTSLFLLLCTAIIGYIVVTIVDEIVDQIDKAKRKSKHKRTKRG